SHSYELFATAASSVVPEASSDTLWFTDTGEGLTVNDVAGGAFTRSVWVTTVDSLAESVTVMDTVRWPGLANACCTLAPESVAPPPKSQTMESMASPSSSAVVASKLTCCPTRGTVGDQLKLAVGEAAWTSPLAIRSEAATTTGTS